MRSVLPLRVLCAVAVAATLLSSLPVHAQFSAQIIEAEHKSYRDRIVRLFTAYDEVPADAPMADAQRLHLLAQVGAWRETIMVVPLQRPSEVQDMLQRDPGRIVPHLAVPLEDRIRAERKRAGEAMLACARAPEPACLIDAAAAMAATEPNRENGMVQLLRLVPVARQAGDGGRVGLLHKMVLSDYEVIERHRVWHQKSIVPIMPRIAMDLRNAGFEDEAYRLAMQYDQKVRLDPRQPETTIVRLLQAERRWREGKLALIEVETIAREGMAAHDDKTPHMNDRVPHLLLTVLQSASPDNQMRREVLAMAGALPDPDTEGATLRLGFSLGRLDRDDLLARLPETARRTILTPPAPAATEYATIRALGSRLMLAARLGLRYPTDEWRARSLNVLAQLPPHPGDDPKEDGVTQRFFLLANMAETEVVLRR